VAVPEWWWTAVRWRAALVVVAVVVVVVVVVMAGGSGASGGGGGGGISDQPVGAAVPSRWGPSFFCFRKLSVLRARWGSRHTSAEGGARCSRRRALCRPNSAECVVPRGNVPVPRASGS
jgi:hypothetical protein